MESGHLSIKNLVLRDNMTSLFENASYDKIWSADFSLTLLICILVPGEWIRPCCIQRVSITDSLLPICRRKSAMAVPILLPWQVYFKPTKPPEVTHCVSMTIVKKKTSFPISFFTIFFFTLYWQGDLTARVTNTCKTGHTLEDFWMNFHNVFLNDFNVLFSCTIQFGMKGL